MTEPGKRSLAAKLVGLNAQMGACEWGALPFDDI
jgi:hypothetical protein